MATTEKKLKLSLTDTKSNIDLTVKKDSEKGSQIDWE